jgi:hypothetical protein
VVGVPPKAGAAYAWALTTPMDATISTPATAIFVMLLRMSDVVVEVIDHSLHWVDRSAGLERCAQPAAISLDPITHKVPLFLLLTPFIASAHGVANEPAYRRRSQHLIRRTK